MAKDAIVILAATDSHADLGRLTNALQAAKEFEEAGDELEIIFDGAGTQWVDELADEDHPAHALYTSLEEYVTVCEYCAGAFEVEQAAEESDAEVNGEFEGHPSMRELVEDDYDIITY